MIISASRRTDIPAFFTDWFINRISQGFVYVRNPMNIHQVSRISLTPSVVDCIVFWTKNPKRIIDKLHHFSKYNYYFQFTLTPYDYRLEPNVGSKQEIIEVFKVLSRRIGKNRIIWRYDPILLTRDITVEKHKQWFRDLAEQMSGYTEKCVISYLDVYRKCERNMHGIKLEELSSSRMREIAHSFAEIGNNCNINIVSCAEEIDLRHCGVEHGKCIDDKLIEEIAGQELIVAKDKNQRAECGCVASIDIGSYNTCPFGCLYCYANFDANIVKRNYSQHNASSPLLFGELSQQDIIKDRKVFSCFEVQRKLL